MEEGILIAPGEDKKTLSILHDDYCEKMAHPHLFSTGKFDYKLDFIDDVIKNMTYKERCNTLNKNPVLEARHFQYRTEIFFKVTVLDERLGKTSYYAIHVEFQVRVSRHIMHQSYQKKLRMNIFSGLIVL